MQDFGVSYLEKTGNWCGWVKFRLAEIQNFRDCFVKQKLFLQLDNQRNQLIQPTSGPNEITL